MNITCLFFLIPFLLILQKSLSTDPIPNYYDKCKPYECGEITIRYPFYDRQKQFHLCGSEGFDVSCNSKNQTTINLDGDAYTVNSISYLQLTINITNSAFSGSALGCPSSLHNLTLDEDTRFSFTNAIKSLILLQNCTTQIKGYTQIKCTEEDDHQDAFVALNGQDVRKAEGLGCKEAVEVQYEDDDGYFDAEWDGDFFVEGKLRRGIVLNYEANNCTVCQDSGGRCGFTPSKDFFCFCPDKAQRGYCHPITYTKQGELRLGPAAILGLSVGLGSVLLVIGCYGLYVFVKMYKKIKRRAKFFKLNGGLLLQQQLSSNDGVVERTKIFTTNELEKATDHFNKDRILGQGGQGTVYKGMLTDGRTVAVKKAKLLDQSQLEQFINEVVILSQINHRNVVKLLGCCLEAEVPLLVYEFVPNGTLSQHIHDPDEDSVLSWELRLKIAAESASAVAYLHSSSSIHIYHRDIKSSNILLDEKNRAKVSDFGSSRTIAIDQTHLTTLVQGTMGYLDPEYFQSYQFTEKSDVYSFGVVLLEMLTGRKPIYRAENMEQKNLVAEFLILLQNSGLPHILDPEIVREAKEEELKVVVELAKCCLSWTGRLRPTMKQVAKTLEMIIESPKEVSNREEEEEGFLHEEFSANAMADWNIMSGQLPAGGGSPLYIDVQPLLPNTI